jgi:hypothetical protein
MMTKKATQALLEAVARRDTKAAEQTLAVDAAAKRCR